MGCTVTAYLSKAEHSPPLDIMPAGTLACSSSSIMYISELIVATSEGSIYTVAKISMQIPLHYCHRPETVDIDPRNSQANSSFKY